MQTISNCYFSTGAGASISRSMTKTIGLLSLLAALAVGGYLLLAQAEATGPTSEVGERAEAEATAQAAAASFRAAAPVLQAWYAEHATYAGATLPPSYGLVLARADAASYCLQSGTGATAQHVVGPADPPAPGAC